MVVEPKNPLLSKTQWTAVIVAICGFIPPIAGWIASNPGAFTIILGVIFSVLRSVTGVPLTFRQPVRYTLARARAARAIR